MKTFPAIVTITAALVSSALPATATPAGHLEGYVPVAAHLPGKHGSFWSTDLWIYSQGASLVHLWYNPEGSDNAAAQSVVMTMDTPVVYVADVVATLFHATGKGTVHYLSDAPVVVQSKTWTPAEHGGTYGQMAYGIPLAEASGVGDGQAGSLRMLASQVDGFRVNVGLVNVSGAPVTLSVDAFARDGTPLAGFAPLTVTLPPYGMKQLDDIFAGLGTGDGNGVVVRATVTSTEGAALAYLSEVDNVTNAGSYEQAFRYAF